MSSTQVLKWGYVFLSWGGPISLEEKLEIVKQGIDMHYSGQQRRKLKRDKEIDLLFITYVAELLMLIKIIYIN